MRLFEGRMCARLSVCAALLLLSAAGAALAGPKDEVASLMPLWRANAPLCQGHPSSQACHDGDMTLFSGLLCASGEAAGCAAVKAAQDASGRWHRSPRLAADPDLKPENSFSWDMALGVQLYVVTTKDTAALERWLAWVETRRPCLVQSPKLDNKTICLVRGWPRWCTDDTEKGCTAKPQNLATLVRTIDTLKVKVPLPAEDKLPGGLAGPVFKRLQDEARDANAELSLRNLLNKSRDLQPMVLVLDAAVNREGYPRHLVGAEVLLARRLGLGSPEVDLAAKVVAGKEPKNPFFQYLHEGGSDDVAKLLLARAPRDAATIPTERSDWAWQRAESDQAWKRANLWDHVFMGRLLVP